jgi:GDP-L-fucose synthase
MTTPKKTLLITGGNGFIGRNIREQLCNRYNILAPSHSELDLLSGIDVKNYFKEHNIDYVINGATVGGSRKREDIDIVKKNVKMYLNLTTYGNFDRIIQIGSGAEYDKTRPLNKISEYQFGEYIPDEDYGFSKYLISRCIGNREDAIGLRLFGIFGKYEDYEFKFISNAIVKNLLDLPIQINQNVVFDWLYVNDFVRLLEDFIIQTPPYRFYNVTPTVSCDLVSIVNIINDISEHKSKIIIDNKGKNNEYTGNNDRLMERYNWNFKFTSIEKSIEELIGYYKSILPTINPKKITKDQYYNKCVVRK